LARALHTGALLTVATKKAPAAKKAPARKTAKRQDAKQPAAKGFAPKVLRFIDEYMTDMNGSAAYKRAGYKATGNSAEVNARRLLRNAQVSLEIARRQAKTAEKLEITREDALREAWNIVKADPRELVQHIVTSCRHCHGESHAFQWRDEAEFERAVEQFEAQLSKWERSRAENKGPPPREPKEAGGFGFDPMKAPHEACPECLGAGVGRTIIKDTRSLSPAALSLYAGVKETKEGIEVKLNSKLDAMEKIFKHLGLYLADKPLPPSVSVGLNVNGKKYELTNDELAAIARRSGG
jgi:phage terminase small subunit